MIEGVGYCAAGAKSGTVPLALATCASQDNPSAALIQAALNRLEPGGAAGNVQIGYTIGINLLGFDKPADLQAHLNKLQKLIQTTRRPVVLYLMGNQFAAPPAHRSLPTSSYTVFSDQTVPKEHYFVNSINAWTLETDAALEINQLRFAALGTVGRWYSTLPATLQDRIVGFTLAGELHHFFPDFANGMGRYDNIRVTDYSPTSVKAFQAWLRNRQPLLSRLNQQWGSKFNQFSDIAPPAKDIRRDKLKGFHQHFDAYAHGLLPVEGWLSALPANHQIEVYLDGKLLGQAEYGLSRQDVYEAVPDIKQAGVGFRYWLDFSVLPRGIHTLQVALVGVGEKRELARRKIVLMGNHQGPPPPVTGEAPLGKAAPAQRFWLDQPRDMQDYYFNPLAKAWNEFRSHQVKQALYQWFDAAVASGLPRGKLYSHQIATATVGTWNPLLTASDASLTGPQPYKKGINLYGGALNIELLRHHYLTPGEPFAVPEFHTQAWKNPKAPAQVLASFKTAGASFVSPYFMTLFPANLRGK
ncbi:beta-galactosidase, partial [Rhodoferax sp.]|uniref:beta-galactosidase n=1 Tax=Rhodoferax sp. TaxID=50421 RepID=UPI002609EB08